MVESDGYEIVHEQTYDYALSNALELRIELAEEALGPIIYALSRNPSAFPIVLGSNIRIAKISARERDLLPAFRVFFRLIEERKRVDLLYVDHGEE